MWLQAGQYTQKDFHLSLTFGPRLPCIYLVDLSCLRLNYVYILSYLCAKDVCIFAHMIHWFDNCFSYPTVSDLLPMYILKTEVLFFG